MGEIYLEFDEERHADLVSFMSQYWLARFSGRAELLERLLPSMTPTELERQIDLQKSLWSETVILGETTRAVDLRSMHGTITAVVYSEVIYRLNGKCVAGVLGLDLEFDNSSRQWRLSPLKEMRGGIVEFVDE